MFRTASSNLTPEEIKAKAKELQEYAHKKFLEKEKERHEEQERNRIRMSKCIRLIKFKLLLTIS